jgi:ABC-type transport system substrate-binding protein
VPPGLIGFDPDFHAIEQEYNPARAKALLDMFGYIDKDGDGWRDLPDGKPFKLTFKYRANEETARQQAELWAKCLAAVGIRTDSAAVQFVDLLKDRKVGKFQMSNVVWTADYPDAQNFLQLLYGPNTNISNDARFKSADYDRLYLQSLKLPDGPARDKLYREMTRIVVVNAPWRFGVHRIWNHIINHWVLGYKKHPILFTSFKYLDIDAVAQKAVMQQ